MTSLSNAAKIFETMEYGPAPEDSSAVRAWLETHTEGFKHFIGGEWRASQSSAQTIVSRNPANGESLATLAVAGEDDIDTAVNVARTAQPGWAAMSGHHRARVLYALARLVQKNSRFLSVLETLDNGKPIRETRDIDIPLVARHFYHHAGWAQLMDIDLSEYEPVGVVGQIIPWNFPLLMLAWKVAPALAMGNTLVLKPAEYTSLSALCFADLCREAGVPPGVVNIVTGAGETGAALARHPGLDKVAFTGSTDVGRLIRIETAKSGAKLSLELGGKSPFIVLEDADLDSAVEGLVDAIWFNQGEVCCAGSRLLVEESVEEALIAKVKRRLQSFRVGDPLDKAIDMGALADPVQRQRIDQLMDAGRSEGAEIWQPDVPLPSEGCFFPPTLVTNVAPSNTLVREEVFGPVLTALSFRTLPEAVSLANNTRYGLAASVWCESINRALEVAQAVKAGVVWVNSTNQFDASSGFGGYRESGFGREGGREGLFEYVKLKGEWTDEPAVFAGAAQAKDEEPIRSAIDRTPKNFIGGKQTRPDNGRTRAVYDSKGRLVGRVGVGERKDIRDAVEAAFKAEAWAAQTAHNRAQILYYLAENLSIRTEELKERITLLTGSSKEEAVREVEAGLSRLFSYAAWADKFDGVVHAPPVPHTVLAINEPIGVVGIVCPDAAPFLSFLSLLAPAIAMGNRAVIVPSERMPLLATDFYQVIETSDVPAGVVNIVTGARDKLAPVLAEHAQVDALWYHGTVEGSADVERLSVHNLKRTWTNHGRGRDWFDRRTGEGRLFLREATQVKNIWLPFRD